MSAILFLDMLMRRCTYIFTLASLVLAQTTVLVDGTAEGSFEGATFCADGIGTVGGWTIVNGTQTNRWAVNTGAGAVHGTQAIYITGNCSASPPPHSYNTGGRSVVHFWRDITVPAGQLYLVISAFIMVQGERGTFGGENDILDIYLAPTSVTPTAGTFINSTYLVQRYLYFSSTWQQVSIRYCGTPGQTYRLIFSWVNDNSVGTQPPAALDQIQVTASAAPPGVFTVTNFPYAHGPENPCLGTNKFRSDNTPSCGRSTYRQAEDLVWTFTAPQTGNLLVNLFSPTPNTSLTLYEGGSLANCANGLTGGARCITYEESNSGNKTLCAPIITGRTYHLILDFGGYCGPISNLTMSIQTEFEWTGGGGNSFWNNSSNWNGCQIPNSCDVDVRISPSAPVFPEVGGQTVRNLTIPAGAKIKVISNLRICGHLICEGEIEGTGTIEFYGGSAYPVQEIRGTLTGGPYRSLPNVRIARQSPGYVQLMTNVQVRGDLRLVGPNDALQLSGKTLYLAGDFDKDARSGFLHGNGKVVFNGSSAQSYTDRAANPAPFHEVEIAQTNPSRLNLYSNLIVTEQLKLTSGIIHTNNYEVRVTNSAPTAVVGGGTTAYIAGKLRRRIGGVGVYDFPIGGRRIPPDYQRAQVEFTTTPEVDNILAEFQTWRTTPRPNSQYNTRECGASYADCSLLSVGYWTLNAYDANLAQLSTSGTYTLTLYPTDYSVCSGARQFGILKKVADEWIVPNPGCYGNPNANIVRRPGLSGFSEFAIGQSETRIASALPTAQGGIGDLILFPNPTSGEVTIRFTVSSVEPVTITVLNALGQVVEQQTLSPAQLGSVEARLQLSHLPAGNYLVRLTQGGTHITRSLQRE